MMKDKNMDELFREKLLNYEQEPPAYLLGNILAGAANVRRKRRIVYWRIAGVAAALLLAFVAGWQFNGSDDLKLNNQVVDNQGVIGDAKINTDSIIKGKLISPQTNPGNTESSFISSKSVQKSDAAVVDDANIGELAIHSTQNRIVMQSDAKNISADENEKTMLKPIRSLFALLNQEFGLTNHIEDIANIAKSPKVAEKSIDQQIMEQNQKQLMAQNATSQKNNRWLVGAQVSPVYNVSRGSQSKQYASNMLNSNTNNPVDLGGGLSVQYKSGKRWSLQSGVYYSGMSQASGNSNYSSGRGNSYASVSDKGSEYLSTTVNVDAANNRIMMNSTAGVIELDGTNPGIVLGTNLEDKSLVSAVVASNARFVQNFDYIEIPLYLRYTILDSRFDIEMLGGFSSNLLVGNQTFMENSSGKSLVGKTQDMESVNYSGTLGLGFKYGLSKRVFLNVEPRFKYYLNSLNSNSSVSYKPYTIGVYTGLSYQF